MTVFLDVAKKLYESARPWGLSTLNIESGTIQVANKFFGQCGCLLEPALFSHCAECGRSSGNNLRVLAGAGDGLYVGFEFVDLQTMEQVAWVFVLDDGSKLAREVGNRAGHGGEVMDDLLHVGGPHLLFNEATEPYWDSPCARLGDVTPDAQIGLIVSDATAGRNGGFAPAMANGDSSTSGAFSVFVAYEPSLAWPEAALAISMGMPEESFTGGFAASQRPRVLLVLNSDLSREVPDHPVLAGHDWVRQAAAWQRSQVHSNVADGHSDATYLNGIYNFRKQKLFGDLAQNDEEQFAARYIAACAFIWFARGAYLGDSMCRNLLPDAARSMDAGYAEIEGTLREVLEDWGWDCTPDLASFLEAAVIETR